MSYTCRRCENKRVSYPGTSVTIKVHSTIWGFSDILIPNPTCKKCVKEIKDFWESGYKKFKSKKAEEKMPPKEIAELNDIIKVQCNQDMKDENMRGIANGLICARSILTGDEPDYVD
jgi:hypothetical protein